MKTLREATWYVRAALLLAALWAVWLLAFVVWAWSVPELKSGDASLDYTVQSLLILVVVVVGLVAAVWRPEWGAVGGGLVVVFLAGSQGGGLGVNGLTDWGDVVLGDQGRTTSWVPLDSIAGVPYWPLLAAGALLVVGGVAHLGYAMDGYVRAAFLLVAVWAVWLTAFVGWAGNTEELGTENNLYMEVFVVSVLAFPAVATGLLVAIAWPRWGAIAGGLFVTVVAALFCSGSLDALREWGEIQIGLDSGRSESSPWVLLDSIWLVPFWVLLPAGALLVVSGIVHVLHPTHRPTPHAGAAA